MRSLIAAILLLFLAQGIVAQSDKTTSLPLSVSDSLMKAGRTFFMKGQLDSAVAALNKAIDYCKNTGDIEALARIHILKSNIYFTSHEYSLSLESLNSAAPLMEKLNDYDNKNKYLISRGIILEKMDDLDSAMYYYLKCEELNSIENPYRNWLVYQQIAGLFLNTESYEKSEVYFQKAYDLTKAKGVRMDFGIVLHQFPRLYYLWNKPEKFARLSQEEQEFRSGSKGRTYDPVHSMVYVDWEKQPFERKVNFMKNVKVELLRGHFIVNAAAANNYLASFYENEKQPDQALTFIRENQQIFTDLNDLQNLFINTQIALRLIRKTGKMEEALTESEKLLVLHDSIISRQQRQNVLEMETKFETAQREKDITLLNTQNRLVNIDLLRQKEIGDALERENQLQDSIVVKERAYSKLLSVENKLRNSQLITEQSLKLDLSRENKLKAEQLRKEALLRTVLYTTVLLISISGIIIFLLYRNQKKKNLLIRKQSDELSVLMREIHHRVKNNLQVVSSLLDLQSQTVSDELAQEVIREGRNRVKSMAIIHQNLYSEDAVKGIAIYDYINMLAASLFDSYNIRSEKIRLHTDIDTLTLDVDTVIPLGLILNELISNSLKYAFRDRAEGEIFISLKKENDLLLLKVRDNGLGFKDDSKVRLPVNSFGMKMVHAFAKKLKADLEIYNDGGACITMKIRKIYSSRLTILILMSEFRILIVEDEPVIAENIAMYLSNNDFMVSGIAYDDQDALQELAENTPDAVLLDINLASSNDGIDIAQIINLNYRIPFLFLTSYSDRETLERAKAVEPWGYVVKPFNEKALIASLEIALSNFARKSTQLVPSVSLDKINRHLISLLSEREFEVVSYIYQGKTNQQIANAVFVSINTIKKHINSAYLKLDVETRTQAIAKLRDLMLK